MSIELINKYQVPSTLLGGISFVAVISALVLTAFSVVGQAQVEQAQRVAMARLSQARRLRYLADDVEVEAPLLPADHYHLVIRPAGSNLPCSSVALASLPTGVLP